MITGYHYRSISILHDDHCGNARPTITLDVPPSLDDATMRKLNRELSDYGIEYAP